MDFFERQHRAKIETKKLVFYFVLAVVLIILMLNVIAFYAVNLSVEHPVAVKDWPLSAISLSVTAGTIVVILIGSLIRYWQVRGGGQAVAEMVGARRLDMDSKVPEERRLINVVEEMSIASGMSVPTIYIMDNEQGLNAFVAGLIPSDTILVVTRGLLDTLNRQELQGVVAHEFSHIFHSDMRINMRLIGILGGILAIGQLGYYLLRSLRYSGGRSRSRSSGNGGQAVIALVAMSLAMIVVGYVGMFFGRLIKAAISRQREYLADAAAVQYSRDNMGIANALYKIKTNGKGSLLDSSHAEDMSHMCFGKSVQLRAFSGVLATHPPIDDRIQALVPGYRSIRRQMDEQVIDDLSPIAQFAGQATAADASATDSGTTSNPQTMVNTIGTITPANVKAAEKIHHDIPDSLLAVARHQAEVPHLMLTLIVQANKTSWAEQAEILKKYCSDESISKINTLRTQTIAAEHRIPIVEIAIPALKQLSPEDSKKLLSAASLLIVADKTISPFEFFLYALLRKHLSDKDASFEQGQIKSYQKVQNELAYLLSMIAMAGNAYDLPKIQNLMLTFVPGWKSSADDVTYNAKQLHEALLKLNRLTPLLKRPLMLTLAELVMEDGQVKTTEMELLRASGIYLECPVPPLVA
jgi:Zn-dependent protease with chaperone function